jgi:DUF1365 family protein
VKQLFLLSICSAYAIPALAYIDPGTGSLIVQSIIGAIAAIGVTLKIYWHKVKVFFMKKEPTTSEETNNQQNESDA